MASLPVEPASADAILPPLAVGKPRRWWRRPRANGWLHLLFGSGPCWYRLLRFGQRLRD